MSFDEIIIVLRSITAHKGVKILRYIDGKWVRDDAGFGLLFVGCRLASVQVFYTLSSPTTSGLYCSKILQQFLAKKYYKRKNAILFCLFILET